MNNQIYGELAEKYKLNIVLKQIKQQVMERCNVISNSVYKALATLFKVIIELEAIKLMENVLFKMFL